MIPLYEEKDFVKKMDSSPRFLVVFVATAAAVVWIVGWGTTQCIDLFCNALGFAATVLPFAGTLLLAILLMAVQGYVLFSAKGVLEHVEGSADNFKKSYAALYCFSVAIALYLSWDPMLAVWECAKICWANGGFGYVLSCLWFLLSSIGIAAAFCGTFFLPVVSLAVLFDIPEKIRKDEKSEVNHD